MLRQPRSLAPGLWFITSKPREVKPGAETAIPVAFHGEISKLCVNASSVGLHLVPKVQVTTTNVQVQQEHGTQQPDPQLLQISLIPSPLRSLSSSYLFLCSSAWLGCRQGTQPHRRETPGCCVRLEAVLAGSDCSSAGCYFHHRV